MSEKISIIVPAYNSENSIIRCINSIRNQTYNNLEIIVVDDGSTDNTAEIVSKISNQDCRVKLISISNGGVSHARNIGIENSNGDYITFVDSDDTIDSEMYENLVELMRNHNAQIAHCSYKNCNENGDVTSKVGDSGKEIAMNREQGVESLLTGKYFAGGACNKLYRREIIGNTRFDETIKINEDVLFNFELFSKCTNTVYTDKAFYNYFAVSTSSTHSAKGTLGVEQGLYVAEKIEKLSQKEQYHNIAKRNLASTTLALWRAYVMISKKGESKKEIKSRVLQFRKEGLYTRRNERIIIAILKYFPLAYSLLYRIYDKIRVKKLDPEQ